MASRIVLIRHGPTTWSAAKRHTGRTDVPLTPAGREAARRLAPTLQGTVFDLVLVSPLRRAAGTAALAGLDTPEHPAVHDPDLMEWDYGEVEGITTDDYRLSHPGWLIWNDGCPGGETIEQVAARARHVLGRCDEVDGEAVLVAHGHLLRILTACWLGLPPDGGRLFALEPATLSVLGYEHESPVIMSWNVEPAAQPA